jgi:hypothetical protein
MRVVRSVRPRVPQARRVGPTKGASHETRPCRDGWLCQAWVRITSPPSCTGCAARSWHRPASRAPRPDPLGRPQTVAAIPAATPMLTSWIAGRELRHVEDARGHDFAGGRTRPPARRRGSGRGCGQPAGRAPRSTDRDWHQLARRHHGAWLLREAGIEAEALHAADVAPYGRTIDPDDGVIVLSHTGGRGYSMTMLERARRPAPRRCTSQASATAATSRPSRRPCRRAH